MSLSLEISNLALNWPTTTSAPALTASAVHVWAWPAQSAALADTLSPDEQERAGRFSLEQLRHRFIAGRGGMRAVVAAAYKETVDANKSSDYNRQSWTSWSRLTKNFPTKSKKL